MDGQILLWIQEHVRAAWLDPTVVWYTMLNDNGCIAIAACLLMLALPKLRRTGAVAAVSLAMNALIVNVAIKPLVGRIRPYEVIDGLQLLVKAQEDFSFPSGHSAAAFAVATAVYLQLPKRYGVPAMVLAVLMALSRLYVGVHYPTDVLAGCAIGWMCAVACCRYSRNCTSVK